MNILIAGGTGFIGTYLKKRFEEKGENVKLVSRTGIDVPWVHQSLVDELEHTDMVINLAGKTINCRHTGENKKMILDSRIKATSLLGNAIAACKNPPLLWVNASASAIYKSDTIAPATETSEHLADDFLADVVRRWETDFFSFKLPSTRQIALRTSVVLGRSKGAFPSLLRLTRLGLGGKVGNGKQIFSWIHIGDYFRIVEFLIQNDSITGVVNCTSPAPLSNAALMKEMRSKVKIPFGLPAPEFAVRIGAFFIGTESSLLLDSTNIYPERLLNAGFKFKFGDISTAISDLVSSK
ncbi:MAG: TIGR01777 family oxidoreductase [Paludibacter sp.]|jgi:uncharacterized protein (TIGR01777 family)|nr:TIGR01777 family oxidoreductase [Paludibacter sp.]